MQVSRREALAAALSAGGAARMEAASGGVPQVTFGKHRISRLIVGGNPVSANSHVSPAMDREMMDYFTVANAKKIWRENVLNVKIPHSTMFARSYDQKIPIPVLDARHQGAIAYDVFAQWLMDYEEAEST